MGEHDHDIDPSSPRPTADGNEAPLRQELARRSRRAFIVGGAAALAGIGGWQWLRMRPKVDGAYAPLRGILEANEGVGRAYFSDGNLAPEYPRSLARMPKANGAVGLPPSFDPATWKLDVAGIGDDSRAVVASYSLDDILGLPRVDMVTELKCIEGWSQIVHWTGARLSDFANLTRLATRSGEPIDIENRGEDLARYVSMATPDGGYFVGLDIESALHPQTLLCYEMNGQPLLPQHGSPLRLVIPVKYGIKHIKRIGSIRFTDTRPEDFWAKRGYDWYSGL